MKLLKYSEDRIPVLILFTYFALDFLVYLTARSWWVPVLWFGIGKLGLVIAAAMLFNLVAAALFAYKGLWLTVLLYLLFIALSIQGWRTWARLAAAR